MNDAALWWGNWEHAACDEEQFADGYSAYSEHHCHEDEDDPAGESGNDELEAAS